MEPNFVIEQIRPELTRWLRQEVLYPEKQLTEMTLEEDSEGYHFGVFREGKLVAVVSLFIKGHDFQFRKFAVAAAMQKMGIGTALLQYITNFAVNEGAKRLWCNARLSAIPFYIKHDFLHTGNFFSKNGIDYEMMEKFFLG
jgi:GNAT superfamily N-acetyltransferase